VVRETESMNYETWVKTVPEEIRGDPLWRMEAYLLGLFAADLSWPDATKLMQDKRTISLSDQLYRAVGSISSNIAEGYSRQSGKDQARFYEYALGSTREGRNWYFEGRHLLGEVVTTHRIKLLTQIARLLLAMIPNERGYRLQEEPVPYVTPNEIPELNELLISVPLP
jgi:four helix bundle protein